MKLDLYEFEQTAKALMVMNPSCLEQYDTWKDLESFMQSMAYQHSDQSNSFSTGGFVLTAYDGPDGERCVRASVSAFVASKYVEEVSKILLGSYAKLIGQPLLD